MLRATKDNARKELLFHPDRDRDLEKIVSVSLGTNELRPKAVGADKMEVVSPVRYAFRSFDRQWIIPDHRLLSMARPSLWSIENGSQVFGTALEAHSPSAGPALTFASTVPDNDHYKGSAAGRVYPLWRDAAATQPNIRPALLAFLAETFGRSVTPEDVMAYLAALMAHPAFTKRFAADLVRPGLRVPLTADAALFAEAAALGREIVWLHCYGERFADPAGNRPKRAPRLPKGEAPTIPQGGGIPGAPEPLPDTMDYDAAKQRLSIGNGFVEHVTPAMWGYEVSGKNVLRQWFSYRKRDRSRPIIGDRRQPSPLDKIQPDHWLADYTRRPHRPAQCARPPRQAGAGAGRPPGAHLRRPTALGRDAAHGRRDRAASRRRGRVIAVDKPGAALAREVNLRQDYAVMARDKMR